MEPEAQRLDREARLAERLAITERVRRDVDDVLEAAAAKRDAYFDWFVAHMRIEADFDLDRERRWADLRLASKAATAGQPAAPAADRAGEWQEADVEVAPLAWADTG
jgi:hypothetical protein